jgi:hypothetical protein
MLNEKVTDCSGSWLDTLGEIPFTPRNDQIWGKVGVCMGTRKLTFELLNHKPMNCYDEG